MVKPATLSEIRTAVVQEVIKITDALPTGTNSIGKISEITSQLPAGVNKIGKIDIDGALPTGTNHLGSVATDNFYQLCVYNKVYAYEDTNFIAGESPAVLDVYTDLGNRTNLKGYIAVDGAGSLLAELSFDGTNYGSQFTLTTGDVYSLDGIAIKKIRLTHSGTDTAYRINVGA